MAADIPQMQSSHTFFMHGFNSLLFEICHVFQGITACVYIVILSCIMFTKHEQTLSFLSSSFQTNLFKSN
jgi:hypothetical protein